MIRCTGSAEGQSISGCQVPQAAQKNLTALWCQHRSAWQVRCPCWPVPKCGRRDARALYIAAQMSDSCPLGRSECGPLEDLGRGEDPHCLRWRSCSSWRYAVGRGVPCKLVFIAGCESTQVLSALRKCLASHGSGAASSQPAVLAPLPS